MGYLLEKVKGERTPDVSLAAHPNAFRGCSASGTAAVPFAAAAIFSYERETREEERAREGGREGECV